MPRASSWEGWVKLDFQKYITSIEYCCTRTLVHTRSCSTCSMYLRMGPLPPLGQALSLASQASTRERGISATGARESRCRMQRSAAPFGLRMLVATLAWRLADIWAKPAGCGIVAPPTAAVAGPRWLLDAWPVCWMHACSGRVARGCGIQPANAICVRARSLAQRSADLRGQG